MPYMRPSVSCITVDFTAPAALPPPHNTRHHSHVRVQPPSSQAPLTAAAEPAAFISSSDHFPAPADDSNVFPPSSQQPPPIPTPLLPGLARRGGSQRHPSVCNAFSTGVDSIFLFLLWVNAFFPGRREKEEYERVQSNKVSSN